MKKLGDLLSTFFGYSLLLLSVLVVVETIGRKWLGFSLQGVDELGGYILAVTTGIAFTVALIDRAHIRIDMVYDRCFRKFQGGLDWASSLLVAAMSVLLSYVAILTMTETIEFGSTAATPWATPLVWPQGVWLATLLLFSLVATIIFVRISRLLMAGSFDQLRRNYGLKVATEELKEELAAFKQRSN
jgi:TRAP-type C4-dicarboxylate transport system permease small subunit